MAGVGPEEGSLHLARRAIYVWEGEPGVVTAHTLFSPSAGQGGLRTGRCAVAQRERTAFSRIGKMHSGRATAAPLASPALAEGCSIGAGYRDILERSSAGGASNVRRQFDAIITGDRVRRGKPHPEPYRQAFQALGVPPRQALVVENAPYGIRSARRARAGRVIALASALPRRFLQEADAVAVSVPQLCRLIRQQLAID